MPHQRDESKAPIFISYAIGESDDAAVLDYIDMCEAPLRRRQRHVVIMDATRGTLMKPEHRKMVAKWVEKNAESLKMYRAGLAFVSTSRWLRGMLTATYWIFRPPYPYRSFATKEEALAWAIARMQARD